MKLTVNIVRTQIGTNSKLLHLIVSIPLYGLCANAKVLLKSMYSRYYLHNCHRVILLFTCLFFSFRYFTRLLIRLLFNKNKICKEGGKNRNVVIPLDKYVRWNDNKEETYRLILQMNLWFTLFHFAPLFNIHGSREKKTNFSFDTYIRKRSFSRKLLSSAFYIEAN